MQISVRAEERFKVMSLWGAQFSQQAKRSNDARVLVITVASGPKAEGFSNTFLRAEFVHREELPG